MAVITVAITGPESSGKSTLAEAIGRHASVPVVAEAARFDPAIIATNGLGTPDAIRRLWHRQKTWASAARKFAELSGAPAVVLDTWALELETWLDLRFNERLEISTDAWSMPDLYLLCPPTKSWTPDPLRSAPDFAERQLIHGRYKNRLTELGLPFIEVPRNGEGARMERLPEDWSAWLKRARPSC